MKRRLKSFAMLRKYINQIEDNLEKGITIDSTVEKTVQNYDEDFPSLGGEPQKEAADEFDSKQHSWREKDKEQKEIWTSRYLGKLY